MLLPPLDEIPPLVVVPPLDEVPPRPLLLGVLPPLDVEPPVPIRPPVALLPPVMELLPPVIELLLPPLDGLPPLLLVDGVPPAPALLLPPVWLGLEWPPDPPVELTGLEPDSEQPAAANTVASAKRDSAAFMEIDLRCKSVLIQTKTDLYISPWKS